VQSTGSRLHAFKNLSALDIRGLPGAEYGDKIAKTKFHNSILRTKTQEIFRACFTRCGLLFTA
jgi:hypothetical protein